jgi:hypothetical protein
VAIAARVLAFSGIRLGLRPEKPGESISSYRGDPGGENGTGITLGISDDDAAAKMLQIIQFVFIGQGLDPG